MRKFLRSPNSNLRVVLGTDEKSAAVGFKSSYSSHCKMLFNINGILWLIFRGFPGTRSTITAKIEYNDFKIISIN